MIDRDILQYPACFDLVYCITLVTKEIDLIAIFGILINLTVIPSMKVAFNFIYVCICVQCKATENFSEEEFNQIWAKYDQVGVFMFLWYFLYYWN